MNLINNFIKKKVLIIAEIGVNHNGNIKLAKKHIVEAKKCGADMVKFQTFKAENLATKKTPKVKYQIGNKKETHYQMLKNLEISYKDFLEIKKFCKKKKILFSSTPYDPESAKFLIKNKIKVLKISSADLIDEKIHNVLYKFKGEIILSIGMANEDEIKKTLEFYKKRINKVYILQCVSNYPAKKNNQNINYIKTLIKKFKVIPGFSDHTTDHECACLAVACGAKIIEKHFTLNKKLSGPDHKASADPKDFKLYVKKIRDTENFLGSETKKIALEENNMKKISRKSIVTSTNLKKGTILKWKHLSSKRPGNHILANRYSELLGKKLLRDLKKDTFLSIRDIK